MSSPYTPVVVNFEVSIDASNAVEIFGYAPDVPQENVIVAEYAMPVNCLYDGESKSVTVYKIAASSLHKAIVFVVDASNNMKDTDGHFIVDASNAKVEVKMAAGVPVVDGSNNVLAADDSVIQVLTDASGVPLRVTLDASGNPTVSSTGSYLVTLDSNNAPIEAVDTYAASSLLEFWEPSDNPNNVTVKLASTGNADSLLSNDFTDVDGSGTVSYVKHSRLLAKGLHRTLCDSFDCHGTAPWSGYSDAAYFKPSDFGHVVLGKFAHELFGHVDATAAISNDKALLAAVLDATTDASGIAALVGDDASVRYGVWTKDSEVVVDGSGVHTWVNLSASPSSNDLARQLVGKVLAKGLDASAVELVSSSFLDASGNSQTESGSAELAYIARQVLLQDPKRIVDSDNSERTRNVHQPLIFIEGDVIYVKINVVQPSVSYGAGFNSTENLLSQYAKPSLTTTEYALKITLGGRTETIA